MAGKNLNTVLNRETIPSSGGLVTIDTSTNGETEYIDKEHLASQISGQLGLGDVVTKNTGYADGAISTNDGFMFGNAVIKTNGSGGFTPEIANNAFNKNFGTTHTTVAYGDHTHNQLTDYLEYQFTDNFTLGAGITSVTYDADDLKEQAPITTTKINPCIKVTVYNVTSNTTMRNIELSDSDVQINMLYNSTSEYTTYVLDDFTISGLTAASSYMIKVSFMANEYSKAIVVPT